MFESGGTNAAVYLWYLAILGPRGHPMEPGEARLTVERTIPYAHDDRALVESLTRLRDDHVLEIIGRWPPEGPPGDAADLEEYRDALERAIAAATKGGASHELLKKLRHLLSLIEQQLQANQDLSHDYGSHDGHSSMGDEDARPGSDDDDGAPGIVGPWED